nr:serine hydrolase domain-containing protein [Thermoanaerobaculia bacterium]
EPLGMEDCWIGLPAERYRAYADRIAATWDTTSSPPSRFGWDSELHTVRPSPAGGGRGPMRQLARFYRMLAGGGRLGETRLLSPQTVEALTARHRVGLFDHTFRHVMDWGLGFIPDSKQYGEAVPYAYGGHCSARTVGHSGYRSSTAFMDREHGLVVALAFNGLPDDATHARRIRQVLEALYQDLGLVATEA